MSLRFQVRDYAASKIAFDGGCRVVVAAAAW